MINQLHIPSKKELTQSQQEELQIKSWPVWQKEVSCFDYTYDETEECFFLEGEVTVEFEGGAIDIKPFDFVVFPVGLQCTWDIKKAVKKHYRFIS